MLDLSGTGPESYFSNRDMAQNLAQCVASLNIPSNSGTLSELELGNG